GSALLARGLALTLAGGLLVLLAPGFLVLCTGGWRQRVDQRHHLGGALSGEGSDACAHEFGLARTPSHGLELGAEGAQPAAVAGGELEALVLALLGSGFCGRFGRRGGF